MTSHGTQPECRTPLNSTLIIVGVVGAFLVILVASAAALLWARRRGKLQARGRRSLTSFENPVYEYEQNVNPNTPNPIDALKMEIN